MQLLDTTQEQPLTLVDLQAEHQILGLLLVGKADMADVYDRLRPMHFAREAHRLIFAAMRVCFEQDCAIDVVSVPEVLADQSKLEQAGGTHYVNSLAIAIMGIENAETCARRVAELWQRRRLLALLDKARAGVIDEGEPDVMERLQSSLAQLQSENQGTREKPHDEAWIEAATQMIDALRHEHRTYGLQTGLRQLDSLCGGLKNGELVYLAARPAMGKSALAAQISYHVAKETGRPVLALSLEMPDLSIRQRLIQNVARVYSHQNFRQDSLRAKDAERVQEILPSVQDVPLIILDPDGYSTCNAGYLRAAIQRIRAKYGQPPALVMVDYLQLMHEPGYENRNQEVSALSRSMKLMAMAFNVPFLVLSQLSRAVEGRGDKRPMLSDLRESGSLEQDADQVWFLFRPDYYGEAAATNNAAELIIAKSRNGQTGTAHLVFDGGHMRFAEGF